MPGPGPISRNTSSGAGAMASTTLSAQTGSRKCCPKRLRVRMHYGPPEADAPSSRRYDLRFGSAHERAIKIAIVADDALVAQRLRLADAPAVQDQRIGGLRPFRGRQRACRAAARPRRDPPTRRCRCGWTRAARDDRPASPGTPSAWPSTTFAVLRPTPGSSTSASIVFGTSPSCCSTSARAMPISDFAFDR